MLIFLLNIEKRKTYFVCQRHLNFLNSDFNEEKVDINIKKLKIKSVPS